MKSESRKKIETLVERYPALSICRDDIVKAAELMVRCYENGGKIMTCGNGGSAADAVHIVGELMKGFCKRRELPENEKNVLSAYGEEGRVLAENLQGTLASVSLINEISLQTAFSNDVLPELGRKGKGLFCRDTLRQGRRNTEAACRRVGDRSRNRDL